MNRKRMAQVLSTHADELIGRSTTARHIYLTDEERHQLTPLFHLAEWLNQSMQPVQPSAGFVRSLGQELVHNAKHQVALTKRMRKTVLIGAAAAGAMVSIASLMGAIVFVIVRWRERTQTRAV
jgi:hypothetical protein